MNSWDLYISTDGKKYKVKADLIYESAQIQRIKVHGRTRSITLQNNFPTTILSKGHKPIKWKLIEGVIKDPEFLLEVMNKLEFLIKHRFKEDQGTLFKFDT